MSGAQQGAKVVQTYSHSAPVKQSQVCLTAAVSQQQVNFELQTSGLHSSPRFYLEASPGLEAHLALLDD